MTFTYETRTTKITYETKAESLERGYDYSGGILDDFADFLRGCGFPIDRDESLVLYNEDKEVILEQVELDAMREDLIELDILREGKTPAIGLPASVFNEMKKWMAERSAEDSVLASIEVKWRGYVFYPLTSDEITDCDVKAEDEWIAWEGGPCPVPRDTRVAVQFADGTVQHGLSVRWIWTHSGEGDDIVAYRVVEELE